MLELARCEWIERRENVIALGPSGTGKTHVALGLGLAACQKGMSVSFTTAAAFASGLEPVAPRWLTQRADGGSRRTPLASPAEATGRSQAALVGLTRPHLRPRSLLDIDELGFVPLSKTGAELLFEMISQRYERGATLITSNLPFVMSKTCILHEEWTETFGTERLTGALLDRLTHHVVRRAGRPLDALLTRLTLRDERRKLSSGAKPRAKIHRNRLIQPALSWPQRAKAASQPPAIWEARLTGRRLVAHATPKSKVACFCAAPWPDFTPLVTAAATRTPTVVGATIDPPDQSPDA